ncbi:hypothetical protein AB0P16_05020 [Dietzia maris]|uniref:hypothetical protein n=1 Tax=Dietzia maris TaxID=37915 RepID=UPI003422B44B
METAAFRDMSIHPARRVRLRDIGRDERWLQDWLAEDLSRLGLGNLNAVRQEYSQVGGGSLDILAESSGTYYSIEVQLGEIDGSHSFRVFDYWAKSKRAFPEKSHVAVLVAESAGGRYRDALEELADLVPLLVIELRTWQGAGEAVIAPELVIATQTVDISSPNTRITASESKSEEVWREEASEEAWLFYEEFLEWSRRELGRIDPDFSIQSYIGMRVGRRVWAPLWLNKKGARIYLPDPDLSKERESAAFEHFQERLANEKIALSWNATYNAGANALGLTLRRGDIGNPVVQDLLRASYAALINDARPWSESANLADLDKELDEMGVGLTGPESVE